PGNADPIGLAKVRIAWGRLAVQCQAPVLAYGLIRILGGSRALAVTNREKQVLTIGRESDRPACLAARGPLAPQHLQISSFAAVTVTFSVARGERVPSAIFARLDVGEMRPSGRNASRHGSLKVITVVMVNGTLASGFCSPILKCAQGAADAAVRSNTAFANFIVTFSVAFPEEA